MTTLDKIVKEKQLIARCEKSLAVEKLKKRKADTRRKIELGGLVIKAGMDGFNKSVVLGAIVHAMQLIGRDETHVMLFESIGEHLFLGNKGL
jgi:hypothetical protein